MEQAALIDRYRRDRRKLLEFFLSSGFIKELRTPSGSINSAANVNFDTLNADYILQCVKSGGIIDLSEATERYLEESAYPAAGITKDYLMMTCGNQPMSYCLHLYSCLGLKAIQAMIDDFS